MQVMPASPVGRPYRFVIDAGSPVIISTHMTADQGTKSVHLKETVEFSPDEVTYDPADTHVQFYGARVPSRGAYIFTLEKKNYGTEYRYMTVSIDFVRKAWN